ncbi:MAG: LOG family protein [Ignavibacteriales bacterium]|nr:LOG family protein [Ignavibacteriales bacterium]
MRKIVTVFGSSIPLEGEEQFEIAYKLGTILAKNNFDVCTGGNHGTMEAVSKGAVEFGGKAIGITLEGVFNQHNKYLTEHIVCSTYFERINKLIETGDAYIALQGGTGTLVELSAAWELMNKNLLEVKPFACHGKIWKPIIDAMEDQLINEKRKTGLVKYFESIEDCTEYVIKKLEERN